MNRQSGQMLGIIAGVATVIGALLPWAKVQTIFGSISVNGTEGGGDGIVTLVLGLLAALVMWGLARGTLLASALGALIVAIAAYDIRDVSNRIDEINSDPDGLAKASVGVGLWITLIAGVVLIVAGITAFANRPKKRTGEPLPPPWAVATPPPPPPPAV